MRLTSNYCDRWQARFGPQTCARWENREGAEGTLPDSSMKAKGRSWSWGRGGMAVWLENLGLSYESFKSEPYGTLA